MKFLYQEYLSLLNEVHPKSKQSRLCGIAERELHDIERNIGYELPEVYRDFMLAFGGSLEVIGLCDNYLSLDSSFLVDVDYEIKRDLNIESAFRTFTFGRSEISYLEYFMLYSSTDDDPSIVVWLGSSKYELIADSFQKFIFQKTYGSLRKGYSCCLSYSVNEPSVISVAENLGFKRQWFSDSRNYYGVFDDNRILFIVEKLEPNTPPALLVCYNGGEDISLLRKEIEKFDVKLVSCP
jgi:hypothetical protein